MVRDWKLIQTLLEDIEAETIEQKFRALEVIPQEIKTRSYEELEKFQKAQDEKARLLRGHLRLIVDSGFSHGIEIHDELISFSDPQLSMAGFDLLDALRSKTIWSRVKKKAEEFSVPITTALITGVLNSFH